MAATDQMPIYVTRETAEGRTGYISLAAWMAPVAVFLVWLNIVAWGLIGLYLAVRTVAG